MLRQDGGIIRVINERNERYDEINETRLMIHPESLFLRNRAETREENVASACAFASRDIATSIDRAVERSSGRVVERFDAARTTKRSENETLDFSVFLSFQSP